MALGSGGTMLERKHGPDDRAITIKKRTRSPSRNEDRPLRGSPFLSVPRDDRPPAERKLADRSLTKRGANLDQIAHLSERIKSLGRGLTTAELFLSGTILMTNMALAAAKHARHT